MDASLDDHLTVSVGHLMMQKRKKDKKLNWRTPGLLLAGSGLLLLGLAVAYWIVGAGGVITGDAAEISAIPAQVDFPAPPIKLYDLNGKQVSLDDYRGQVILINNWATWCPPCKAEMPTLQTFYELYQDRGFVLIAIDAGDPVDDVQEFTQSYGLTFPVWLDPDSEVLSIFRNDALPSSYVVDSDGSVRLAWTGAISLNMLEKYVTPMLED